MMRGNAKRVILCFLRAKIAFLNGWMAGLASGSGTRRQLPKREVEALSCERACQAVCREARVCFHHHATWMPEISEQCPAGLDIPISRVYMDRCGG